MAFQLYLIEFYITQHYLEKYPSNFSYRPTNSMLFFISLPQLCVKQGSFCWDLWILGVTFELLIQPKLQTILYRNPYVVCPAQSNFIYLLTGRPRPPRFTSEVIGYRPDSYNITWITDSYQPITEYKILYRRSDVSTESKSL